MNAADRASVLQGVNRAVIYSDVPEPDGQTFWPNSMDGNDQQS